MKKRDEILNVLINYDDYRKNNIRLNGEYLETRYDTKFNEIYNELTTVSTDKFKKKKRKRKYRFNVNNMDFEYTANVKETIGEYREDLSYVFYLFNENDEMINYYNVGGIYG